MKNKAERWKKYLVEFYEDKSNTKFGEEDIKEEENKGEYILREEFYHAIEHLKKPQNLCNKWDPSWIAEVHWRIH